MNFGPDSHYEIKMRPLTPARQQAAAEMAAQQGAQLGGNPETSQTIATPDDQDNAETEAMRNEGGTSGGRDNQQNRLSLDVLPDERQHRSVFGYHEPLLSETRCSNCLFYFEEASACKFFHEMNEALPGVYDLEEKVTPDGLCNSWKCMTHDGDPAMLPFFNMADDEESPHAYGTPEHAGDQILRGARKIMLKAHDLDTRDHESQTPHEVHKLVEQHAPHMNDESWKRVRGILENGIGKHSRLPMEGPVNPEDHKENVKHHIIVGANNSHAIGQAKNNTKREMVAAVTKERLHDREGQPETEQSHIVKPWSKVKIKEKPKNEFFYPNQTTGDEFNYKPVKAEPKDHSPAKAYGEGKTAIYRERNKVKKDREKMELEEAKNKHPEDQIGVGRKNAAPIPEQGDVWESIKGMQESGSRPKIKHDEQVAKENAEKHKNKQQTDEDFKNDPDYDPEDRESDLPKLDFATLDKFLKTHGENEDPEAWRKAASNLSNTVGGKLTSNNHKQYVIDLLREEAEHNVKQGVLPYSKHVLVNHIFSKAEQGHFDEKDLKTLLKDKLREGEEPGQKRLGAFGMTELAKALGRKMHTTNILPTYEGIRDALKEWNDLAKEEGGGKEDYKRPAKHQLDFDLGHDDWMLADADPSEEHSKSVFHEDPDVNAANTLSAGHIVHHGALIKSNKHLEGLAEAHNKKKDVLDKAGLNKKKAEAALDLPHSSKPAAVTNEAHATHKILENDGKKLGVKNSAHESITNLHPGAVPHVADDNGNVIYKLNGQTVARAKVEPVESLASTPQSAAPTAKTKAAAKPKAVKKPKVEVPLEQGKKKKPEVVGPVLTRSQKIALTKQRRKDEAAAAEAAANTTKDETVKAKDEEVPAPKPEEKKEVKQEAAKVADAKVEAATSKPEEKININDPKRVADMVKTLGKNHPDAINKTLGHNTKDWDSHKPLVNDLYEGMKDKFTSKVSLDQFKDALVKAHQDGHLELGRIDMPQSVENKESLGKSSIKVGNAQWDTVNTNSKPAKPSTETATTTTPSEDLAASKKAPADVVVPPQAAEPAKTESPKVEATEEAPKTEAQKVAPEVNVKTPQPTPQEIKKEAAQPAQPEAEKTADKIEFEKNIDEEASKQSADNFDPETKFKAAQEILDKANNTVPKSTMESVDKAVKGAIEKLGSSESVPMIIGLLIGGGFVLHLMKRRPLIGLAVGGSLAALLYAHAKGKHASSKQTPEQMAEHARMAKAAAEKIETESMLSEGEIKNTPEENDTNNPHPQSGARLKPEGHETAEKSYRHMAEHEKDRQTEILKNEGHGPYPDTEDFNYASIKDPKRRMSALDAMKQSKELAKRWGEHADWHAEAMKKGSTKLNEKEMKYLHTLMEASKDPSKRNAETSNYSEAADVLHGTRPVAVIEQSPDSWQAKALYKEAMNRGYAVIRHRETDLNTGLSSRDVVVLGRPDHVSETMNKMSAQKHEAVHGKTPHSQNFRHNIADAVPANKVETPINTPAKVETPLTAKPKVAPDIPKRYPGADEDAQTMARSLDDIKASPEHKKIHLAAHRKAHEVMGPEMSRRAWLNVKRYRYADTSIELVDKLKKAGYDVSKLHGCNGCYSDDGDIGITLSTPTEVVQDLYIHEYMHSVDRNDQFSGTKDWNEAWKKEIAGSSKWVWKQSKKIPTEGFADFGRLLLYNSWKDLKVNFPMCTAFFEKNGLYNE